MNEPGITPEEILNFAVDQIPVPVIIASAPDVTITHFNRAALDLLARTDTEITGIPLEFHREYWPTFYPDGTPYRVEDLPLTRAIKKGEVSKDVEIIVRHPDGDRWISASAAPLRDKDGTIVAGIVVFPEITFRKTLEKDTDHLNRVLRSIRSVNQLIVREKDRKKLIEGICKLLVENRGSYGAWIALFAADGKLEATAAAGDSVGLEDFFRQLGEGKITACGRDALGRKGIVLTKHPPADCPDCPLASRYSGRGGMTVRLEYGGRVYGLLCVSMPSFLIASEEEQSLFNELSEDISSALSGIEAAEKREQAEQQLQAAFQQLQDANQQLRVSEQHLRVGEEKYRGIVENAAEGIVLINTRGTIMEVNPRTMEICGLERDELVDKNFLSILPGLKMDIKKIAANFRALLKGKPLQQQEWSLINKQGEKIIISVKYSLVKKEGKVTGLLALIEDITSHKRAEENARAYDRLCRMAKDLICLADIATATFTQVNPAFTEVLGYSEEELLGRPFLDYVHPDDREKTVAVIEEKLKQGDEVISFVNRYRCKNGSYRWLDWNSHPVEEEGVTYAIAHDITEKKKAEEELTAAYQFLDRVIDMSPFAMWISDDRGTVIRANRALCQTINLSPEAIIGSYNVLKDKNLERAGVMGRVREVFDRHRPARFSIPWGAEYSGGRGFEKARDMFIDVAIFPILDQEGKLTNVVCQWVDIIDQKTAEKALEESLLWQQAVVRAGRVGLWDWELTSDKVSYSAEWKRQIGYEEEEISDDFSEWESRVHPDDLRPTLKAIRGYIDSDRTTYYEVEFRFRHKDGSYRWILAPATIVRDEKGRACRVMGAHIDITERKQAEEELRRSEELLRQTGEMARVGGWEIDLATDTVTWSPTTRSIHEVPEDYQPTLAEAINFFDPAARSKLTEAIRQAREDGAPYDLELPFITARGRKLWARTIGKADFKDGRCVRVHGTFQDISGLKEARDALEESERRYRQLVENINDAIFSIDREGLITYTSPVIEEITGYRPEETAGKHFADFIFEEDLAVARKQFEAVIGGREETREYRLLHKQGGEHWVRISARPLSVDGEIVGLQGTIADIEERKRIEAELLKARNLESLGLLAGGIAHDFNNILTAILGNISYLRMGIDRDSEAEEALTEAESACRQANHLTRQLLTFSSGGQPIAQSASLEKILREAARFSLHGSNVKCRFRIADDLLPVLVDPGQIAQVINNLVINADQAMPEGGEIEIRCVNREVAENEFNGLDPGRYVRIEIADQGIGIGPDQISRIFDPYFTTKEKGRGLGLATAFSIIRNHRGRLTVDSSPGEGTVFTILLPAAAETVEEEKEEERIIRGRGRILVMDDEAAVLKIAARVLESLGYQVETAREGKEAVELYRKALSAGSPFKAVILDLTIQGGMGGVKTLAELKKIDPAVKAIVSSGYSTDGIMAEYEGAGFAGMIAKPYELKTVSRVLADVLNG